MRTVTSFYHRGSFKVFCEHVERRECGMQDCSASLKFNDLLAWRLGLVTVTGEEVMW